MTVLSIEALVTSDDYATVYAVVDDIKVRWVATYYDPEEREPALCKASFLLGDDETLPSDENELLNYVNDLQLDWTILPSENYDDD